jgi:hypothetical protein
MDGHEMILYDTAWKRSVIGYVMGNYCYLTNKGVDFQGEWNSEEAFAYQLNCLDLMNSGSLAFSRNSI